MSFILQPWQLFFMVLASWVHREQQKTIEFYQAELEAVMKASDHVEDLSQGPLGRVGCHRLHDH